MTILTILVYIFSIYFSIGFLWLTWYMIGMSYLSNLSNKHRAIEKLTDEINEKTEYKVDAEKIKSKIRNFGVFDMIQVIMFWPKIMIVYVDLKNKTRK